MVELQFKMRILSRNEFIIEFFQKIRQIKVLIGLFF